MHHIAVWLIFGLGLAMIVGCFVPKRYLPPRMPHDGYLHIAAFALLSFPIGLTPQPFLNMAGWAAGLFAFGILIEIGQILVPDRHFGWDDIAYNAGGILLGIGLGWAISCFLLWVPFF